MQVLSQAAGNPEAYFANCDRREVPHLPRQSTGITGSDPDPLRQTSIRKLQKCIGTRGHEIFLVPRTRRVIHSIRGRPDQDARARKQERKNAMHRTIEI